MYAVGVEKMQFKEFQMELEAEMWKNTEVAK